MATTICILDCITSLTSVLSPALEAVNKITMQDLNAKRGAHKQIQCSISALHAELVAISQVIDRLQQLVTDVQRKDDKHVSEILSLPGANRLPSDLKALCEKISEAYECCQKNIEN